MRGFAVLLIAIATASPATAEEWWHGSFVWEGSTQPCGSNDSFAEYADKTVKYWESECKVLKATKLTGLEAVVLNMECTGEGETFSKREMLLSVEGKVAAFPPLRMLKSCSGAEFPTLTPAKTATQCAFNSQIFRSPLMNDPDPHSYQELRFVSGIAEGEVELTETRAGKPVWRSRGKHVCSNGAVICQVEFPRKVNEPLSMPYEPLPSPDGSMTDTIVIPAFRQTVHVSERGAVFEDVGYGGLVSDLLDGFVPKEDEILMPFNVYRYAGCATN